MLDDAWAWGFDVDAWRAHLTPLTWPEVLRQFAIAAGLGPPRPRAKKEARPKPGEVGDELVLKLPPRFGEGTVKAAVWHVLVAAGKDGMAVNDITAHIQQQGLRDLSASKTPEVRLGLPLMLLFVVSPLLCANDTHAR